MSNPNPEQNKQSKPEEKRPGVDMGKGTRYIDYTVKKKAEAE